MVNSLTDYERRKMLKKYKSNESLNYHNENAVDLINRFGTKSEKEIAKNKMKDIEKQGYTANDQSVWMSKHGHKHYYKLIKSKKKKYWVK